MTDTVPAPPLDPPPAAKSQSPGQPGKPHTQDRFVEALAPPKQPRPRRLETEADAAAAEEQLRAASNTAVKPEATKALANLRLSWAAWAIGLVAAAWLLTSTGPTGVSDALGDLAAALEPDAAFQVVENFEEGVSEAWLGTSPQGSENGLPRAAGFGLHADTLNFADYRFEFETRILRQGVSWIVRGSDENNYYGFRLIEKGPEKHILERFLVADGEKTALWSGDVELVGLRRNGFRRVSARVMGDSISTFVDGLRVDYFRDVRLDRGGAGFLASRGDRAELRYFSVSGNQDSWGLFVYGAVQTLRSAQAWLGPEPLNAEVMEDETPPPGADDERQAAM